MVRRDDRGRRDGKAGRFSAREVRALLWLLPVLAIASWLVWEISRPADKDRVPDPFQRERSDARLATEPHDEPVETHVANSPANITQPANTPGEKFVFDPNTVDYHDLIRLGFSRGEALGIVKYRERGKIFEIPEDFAACYQVSEDMYRLLKPYIRIAEKYRLKPFRQNRPETAADTPENPELPAISPATVMVASPVASPVPPLVNLNTADSTTLRSVSGIGEKTVTGIIEYRARLGGFVRAEQLAEVRGVTEQNYERMVRQIFVDTLAIQKIDINFASAKKLAQHPYIRGETLRKLLKTRQLKGGWRTAGELEKDNIFTQEELARLRPYLLFN